MTEGMDGTEGMGGRPRWSDSGGVKARAAIRCPGAKRHGMWCISFATCQWGLDRPIRMDGGGHVNGIRQPGMSVRTLNGPCQGPCVTTPHSDLHLHPLPRLNSELCAK
jgi:hypothetical protein